MTRQKQIVFGLVILAIFLFSVQPCLAVSTDGFVMNVVLGDKPVNEVVGNEVAIPFDSEYKLRLKNNNNRRCTVKITIDGASVSMLGDIVLNANGEINLERFLDRSLESGKRFKFVPLDNPDVDDPDRKENGEIVAEFRLEKETRHYIVPSEWPYDYWEDPEGFVLPSSNSVFTPCSSNVNFSCSTTSSVSPGATVGGSESTQRFSRTNMDVEDAAYWLRLKMVGLRE